MDSYPIFYQPGPTQLGACLLVVVPWAIRGPTRGTISFSHHQLFVSLFWPVWLVVTLIFHQTKRLKMQGDETRDLEMTSDHEEGEEELMPFMDTFYSLASNEAEERSFAASSMIKCLFYKSDWDQDSIDATVKDGSYALTRLMNGLCSGRASARQGFASCLSIFLKVSFKMGPENESKKHWIDLFMVDSRAHSAGAEEFVRNTLKECTNFEGPAKGKKNTGKKSRSDERDYRFGRLFGILGILRSGSLVDASEKVSRGFDFVTFILA